MKTWRWLVYEDGELVGEVLAVTFPAACRRAAIRFGNRPFTVVRAGRQEVSDDTT